MYYVVSLFYFCVFRTAGFVEQTALKFGLQAPSITLEQMSLRRTKVMANLVWDTLIVYSKIFR